jgi:hypothetical protein
MMSRNPALGVADRIEDITDARHALSALSDLIHARREGVREMLDFVDRTDLGYLIDAINQNLAASLARARQAVDDLRPARAGKK